MKRYGILTLKILLWILGSVIFLILLLFVLIRIPAVQDFARKKAVTYLEGKIKTKVEINRISLDLPKQLVLEDIYFEDQKQDTLLAGDTLKVDISLLKLLNNKLEINLIDFRGITANIQRTPDSVFNFDYIINAFVSEQKKEPKPEDTTSTMKFSLDRINLDRIKVNFQDAASANDINIFLGHFDTRIKEFDLEKMKFSVPKINLSNVNARMVQSKPAVEPKPEEEHEAESEEPIAMDLELGIITLKKIKVYYQNDISAMKTRVDLGNFETEFDKLDLTNKNIALKNINLNNSNILFVLGKKAEAETVKEEVQQKAEAESDDWRFSVNSIKLDNNNLRFDDFNSPAQAKGIDFSHLNIKSLALDAEDLVYAVDTISGTINDGSFRDKSGFDLRKLQTKFFYGKTGAYLNDLDVQTSKSRLKNYIRIKYPSIESLSKDIGSLAIDANLNGSRLGFLDILVFVPDLAGTEPFKGNPNAVLTINGRINGRVDNLNIPNLEISGFRNTRVRASAKITGLPNMDKAFFDLRIADLSSGSADLAAFVPAGTIPSSIRLPQSLRLNGTFRGSMADFNTNLNLNSSYGSANVNALYNAKIKGSEKYKADISFNNFNLGRLLKQDTVMGRITLTAKAEGTGLDPKTMSSDIAAKIQKAEYNKYTYRGLNFTASAKNGSLAAKANMADPNISFRLNAAGNMKGKYPAVKMALNLDSINLKKLNFTTDDMRFHGKLAADLPTADPDYLNGNINLSNTIIARGTERIQLDTVSIVSTATADSSSLRLHSEFLNANLRGKYKLTELGAAMQDLINRYFTKVPAPPKASYSPVQLTFNASLMNAPVLQQFVPDLEEMANVTLSGNFDSADSSLVINASAPRIIYGSNDLNNLQFKAGTENEALNYALTLGSLNSSQFQLQNLSITGTAKDNILTTNLQVLDDKKKKRYQIAGNLKSLPDAFEFSLNPNGLILNYDAWRVSAENAIQFGGKGIEARNFVLSNNQQQLSIQTSPPGANNPLAVKFSDFKIETLTQIAAQDSLLAGGTINGDVLVRNLDSSPVFTSDLNIQNFSFRGDTVGNIALKVNNERENAFAADVRITGNGNDVNLNGYYFTGNSSMNMDLDIQTLNLKSIEGFTMGNLKDASGSLDGKLKITGTADAPKINGGIHFNNTAFTVSMLNSHFRIPDNTIRFNEEGIGFNEFTLIDSAGNKAVIDGMVYTKTFTDYRFGLHVNSRNFQVLNSTAVDNELYYGKLFINTRLRIAGDMNQPVVDGSLDINPETNLTVVLPQSDPAIEERQGIVEFVDKDNPMLATTLTSDIDSSLNQSAITGMDVAVNISIDKEAEFNLIIDAANGDFLKLRGEAELSGGIDPSGKTSLTGMYTLQEGAYELSFNFIKRRFDIKPGSTITWNGEPMDAILDVTAIYVAETAPLDLVQNQLGDASASELNTYKQKLPFEVHLAMKGELMKPDITFDIVLPEENYNVSTDIVNNVNSKLTQLRTEPSELNKQVFALLLLNRFVAENLFVNSAGGGGMETLARQSVSKILSEQLNNLAGDLIAGVELNFDLESSEDYTTGQRENRTDLNVGLSKRLLNDRLKVTVGSNFELEGPRQPNRDVNNIAVNVEVEYQLSKDGRYLLRAYQKDEYQVALQGQIVETGVGFVINLDYNEFKDIFTKNRREKARERRRAEREAKKNENIDD